MICGHCGNGVHEAFDALGLGSYVDDRGKRITLGIEFMACPECNRLIAFIGEVGHILPQAGRAEFPVLIRTKQLVFPIVKTTRKRPPKDVPDIYANDYYEACLVLNDSPKASAALSRRCLQNVLHNKVGIKSKNLDTEIDEWIERGGLPTNLVESLHALRQIGNFAAHPIKIRNTGEIAEVVPGEADWSLDTLEGVFDHCFIQPAALQRRRDDINAKLKAVGKPPV